jgi:DNA-binding transcriptional MocR family regulator
LELAREIEELIAAGKLRPGERLPSIRQIARSANVSPPLVSRSIAELRRRGLVQTRARQGMRVAERPPLVTPDAEVLPAGLRDASSGNPDPQLLPPLEPAVAALDLAPRLYGDPPEFPDLIDIARATLTSRGIDATSLMVAGGALDAIDRVLQVHLRAGDAVALEDPTYSGVLDLLRSRNLTPAPVPIDDEGMHPERLAQALADGAKAVISTTRANNPFGSAVSAGRCRELRTVLARFPDRLLIEDDHAGPIAGADLHTLTDGRERWVYVQSTAKWLGPDLRVALVAGDRSTVAYARGRQALAPGWISHILQQLVAHQLSGQNAAAAVARAETAYTQRRELLIEALAKHDIHSHGRSGLNVWIPVPDEARVVQAAAASGWAIAAGQRFRIASPPAVRVTTALLEPTDLEAIAEDLTTWLRASLSSRRA